MGQIINIKEIEKLKKLSQEKLIFGTLPIDFNSNFIIEDGPAQNSFSYITTAKELILIIEDNELHTHVYLNEIIYYILINAITYYINNKQYISEQQIDELIHNKVYHYSKLSDAIIDIPKFLERHTLYVKRPWNNDSEVMIGYRNSDEVIAGDPVQNGYEYFLEVFVIRENFSEFLDGTYLQDKNICKSLIYYAEYDAFLFIDE